MWSSPRVVIICTRFVVLIVGTVSRTCRDIEEDTAVVLSLVLRVYSGSDVGQAHISLGGACTKQHRPYLGCLDEATTTAPKQTWTL